jgi:hypothetical protein
MILSPLTGSSANWIVLARPVLKRAGILGLGRLSVFDRGYLMFDFPQVNET